MGASKNPTPNGADLLERIFGSDLLAQLTNTPITGEEVEFHNGNKIILPEGMTYETAYEILERLQQEAETSTEFGRRFMYRPNDGAYATLQTIKNLYGMVLGKATWFQPAQSRTIAISATETMQVPWGNLEIPVFPGLQINLCDMHHDREYGAIFEIHAMGPKKYGAQLEVLFDAIADYLKNNSIYRGRAIRGSANPEFLDLGDFNADHVVFSDEATAQLEGLVHAPIRYTDAMRREGVPLKRTILLEGPFGTGKTSELMILAEIATANGWTFISAKPGEDKIDDVLRTAKLYQPAIVGVEDIDTETSSGDADAVTLFLDTFDGITAKGGEIVAVLTTNHIEKIHKGMLRPGRLDGTIHIGHLDRNGIERLIKAVIDPLRLAPDVDFDAVATAMDGFYPAFVKESITRSKTIAIGQNKGVGSYVIDTEALVTAATSLHEQLRQLEEATEGVKSDSLGGILRKEVVAALTGGEVGVAVPQIGLSPVVAVEQD